MLKHLVFDCDGVLWQGTNDGYFRCYHRAACAAGLELDFEQAKRRLLQNWGFAPRTEIAGMIAEHPERVDEVLEHYERLIRSDLFLDTAHMVPGVDAAIRELSEHYRLSAVTGMHAENLEVLLERFALRDYFTHRISTIETDDPAKQKPSGYPLRRLMEAEGLRAEEVLCIGDADSDVEMARTQNVPIVVVLTGHLNESQARALGVTAILPSATALPGWIRSQRQSMLDRSPR